MGSPRLRRRTVTVLLVIAVAVAAFSTLRTLGGRWTARAAETPTVIVDRGPFEVVVEVTGSLKAVRSHSISAPRIADSWEFTISAMEPEGSQVKAGQVIANLDAQQILRQQLERDAAFKKAARELEKREEELRAEEAELDAHVEEARVKLERARLKAARTEETVSRLDLEKARVDFEQATLEMELTRKKVAAARGSARAELDYLRSRLEHHKERLVALQEALAALSVRAPVDGLLIYAEDWRGEKKKVGESVYRGWKFLEIPDLTEMEAQGEVEEVDARHVRSGQRAELFLEAQPGIVYGGTVEQISSLAKKRRWDRPYKVFDVLIRLDETDESIMRPGMRVTGRVITEILTDVLAIPETAVEEVGEEVRVYVAGSGRPGRRSVRLGRRSGGRVVVEGGLEEGDIVYLRPPRS